MTSNVTQDQEPVTGNTPQGETHSSEALKERTLLSLGIVSMDGLEGMDRDRAVRVAQHSVAKADRHFREALKAGLIKK
jgi:hypothetical protein